MPQPIERSTYVYASCAVTMLLIWQWRAIDLVIWDVKHPVGRGLLNGLFAAGWLMVPLVSLMINHFDLFGTRQVWLYLRVSEYTPLPFRTPLLYGQGPASAVPGLDVAFWATPTMTAGHLLFAVGMTVYMLVAVAFEERDLIAHFGQQYEEYRRRVPKFVPCALPPPFRSRRWNFPPSMNLVDFPSGSSFPSSQPRKLSHGGSVSTIQVETRMLDCADGL